MSVTDIDVTVDPIIAALRNGETPTAEERAAWSAQVQTERTGALDAFLTAEDAVLQADFRAAALVIFSDRAGTSLRNLSTEFQWLTNGAANSTQVGTRLKATAAYVAESGGSVRWSSAWGTIVTAEKAAKAAKASPEEQASRETILSEANVSQGTYETALSLVGEGSALTRIAAVNPSVLVTMGETALAKALEEVRAGKKPTKSSDAPEDPVTALAEAVHALSAATARVVKASALSRKAKDGTVSDTGVKANAATRKEWADILKATTEMRKAFNAVPALAASQDPTAKKETAKK